MLFLMRALSHRAPLAVPRLLAAPLAGAVPPTGMLPTHCGRPAACLSSAIRLRPGGTGVSLQSSPFGQRDQWGNGQRAGLRTGGHSSSHDPRGHLLRKFSSLQPDEPAGAAAPERQPAEADGSNGSAEPSAAAAAAAAQSSSSNGAGVSQPSPTEAPAQASHASYEDSYDGGSSSGTEGEPSPPVPAWKLRLGEYLESSQCHMIVVSLVMLDLTIVVTELILGSLFAHGTPMPHAVHVAEEILSWSSISILGIFALELIAKLICFGTQYYAHSKWHFFDAVVVTLSLGLELTLKGVAQEAASLLVFFRLWKYTPEFMRVARHGPEVARVARHTPEIARILSHTPEFLRISRHMPEFLRVFRHAPEFLRVFRHVPEFFRFLRHTPELFRLWRVARIAHGAAAAMELQHVREAEEQRHLLAQLQKDLAAERRKVQVLEAEVLAMRERLTPEQQQEVAQAVLASIPPAHGEASGHHSPEDAVWASAAHGHAPHSEHKGHHHGHGHGHGHSHGSHGKHKGHEEHGMHGAKHAHDPSKH